MKSLSFLVCKNSELLIVIFKIFLVRTKPAFLFYVWLIICNNSKQSSCHVFVSFKMDLCNTVISEVDVNGVLSLSNVCVTKCCIRNCGDY